MMAAFVESERNICCIYQKPDRPAGSHLHVGIRFGITHTYLFAPLCNSVVVRSVSEKHREIHWRRVEKRLPEIIVLRKDWMMERSDVGSVHLMTNHLEFMICTFIHKECSKHIQTDRHIPTQTFSHYAFVVGTHILVLMVPST